MLSKLIICETIFFLNFIIKFQASYSSEKALSVGTDLRKQNTKLHTGGKSFLFIRHVHADIHKYATLIVFVKRYYFEFMIIHVATLISWQTFSKNKIKK